MASDLDFEKRTVAAQFEVRAEGSTPVLEGYAATFDTPYDMGHFEETISRSAFNRTLNNNPDVRLLIDHEGQPLARTKSGTLRLSTDDHGLHMRANLEPRDPDVQRLLPKLERGDLDQMSFAFRLTGEADVWEVTGSRTLRTIREASLQGGDVSVVTYPANPTTSVAMAMRAKDMLEANFVFAEQMLRELRVGRSIGGENVAKLKHVLDLIATADNAVDAAQPLLAEVIGVPNPDADDEGAEPAAAAPAAAAPRGRSLDTARRIVAALALQ